MAHHLGDGEGADVADLAGLGEHGSDHTDGEGTVILAEDQASAVGDIDGGVDDGEVGLRVLLGDLAGPVRGAVADGDDQVVALFGHGSGGQLLLADVGVLDDPGLHIGQTLLDPADATGC